MNEEIWIPFIVFASIFGYLAFRRWLEYRETVALAAHGLVKPRESGDGRDSLRWGISLAALGLALTAGLYPVGWMVGEHFPLGIGPWLLPGFILLFLGLGLVLIHLVTRPPAASAMPPPTPEWIAPSDGPPAASFGTEPADGDPAA